MTEVRHPHKIATGIDYETLRQKSGRQEYFTVAYANEFPFCAHTTPAGNLVDHLAKPLRKKAKYDLYEWFYDKEWAAKDCKGLEK